MSINLPASLPAELAQHLPPALAALSPVQFACVVGTAVLCTVLLFKLAASCIAARKTERLLASIPKVPSRYPFSHLIELVRSPPWDVMLSWLRRFGPLVRFHFFGHTYVIVGDPVVLEHVLATNMKNFQKDPDSYKPFMAILGTGLITSHGHLWRRQRALISPVLRSEILHETAEISRAAVDRLSAKLDRACGTGEAVEMGEEFRHLTLQVIGQAILSMGPEECDRVFPDLYLPIVEEANKVTWAPWRPLLPLKGTRECRHAVNELNRYITKLVVDRRRELVERGATSDNPSGRLAGTEHRKVDILDRIMLAVEADGREWNEATVCQLRDEIKTFLFAGHETSSMMLTWALYLLTENQRCMDKVVAEARRVYGEKSVAPGADMPDFDTLNTLDYTYNVLRETLRIKSVVPVVTREAVEEDRCGDVYFPAGCKLVLHMKVVHENPNYWPEPEVFRPERFEAKFDPYHFVPFIEGPRKCIGQHFSLLESKIVLSLLCARYVFRPAPGEVGAAHPFNIPIGPLDRMRMVVDRHPKSA